MLRTWYGAGLVAGITVFLWGGLAHMVLGLGGESTFKTVPNETITALGASLKQPGLYVFPYSTDMNETAKLVMTNPQGILIFTPAGSALNMGSLLGVQAISDFLACLVMAWIFSMALPRLQTFISRVGFVMALGLFSALTAELPYWNWYRFPTDFTAFGVVFKLSAALLAGVVLASLMGRPAAELVPVRKTAVA